MFLQLEAIEEVARMESTWSARLRKKIHHAERYLDRGRRSLRRGLGLTKPALIQPYLGFGTADRLWFRGRVIEDRNEVAHLNSQSLLTNLRYTYKRYATREIPGAKIGWRIGSQSGELITDDEGYFDLTIAPGADFDESGPWQNVDLTLLDAGQADAPPLEARCRIRTPRPDAQFGVISDIDDTIVKTGAFNFMKHWRTVVSHSAAGRQVLPGTSALYSALAAGAAGPETNPVVYVSSSPWNLADLFERFMALNDIPLGPMLLKDFGLDETKWFTGGHSGHKGKMIDRVMKTWPALNFILIGDSGQRDAHIYADAIETHPGRVMAVFIRDVAHVNEDQIARLKTVAGRHSIPVAVTDDLSAASEICAQNGWIGGQEKEEVEAEIEAMDNHPEAWLHRHADS
ncbi:App1 family protein [Notoacmeibacter marinus]|nr:phosphatase domain-containing protein [Notoacmeibacter marinus]